MSLGKSMSELVFNITPIPKPRMTRSDSWKKRPCVVRYWKFKDELRAVVGDSVIPHPVHLLFVLPMPDSWSLAKKTKMLGLYHRQRPDADNLWKAWNDCLYDEDGHIADVRVTKVWGHKGQIIVRPLPAFNN
jgi:Holliday junction resolvase RusA-like endonuclease